MKKFYKILSGVLSGILGNLFCLYHIALKRKLIIFQLDAANQLSHILPVLFEIKNRQSANKYVLLFMANMTEISALRKILSDKNISGLTLPLTGTSFLIAWHIAVGLDQRMRYPAINLFTKNRICIFHGQPTKGNVYSGFNYRQIDHLFFYGPLMRQYYQEQKEKNPKWPLAATWNIGQPKSDLLFQIAKPSSNAMALNPKERLTVLYAPSFENCSSLATHGKEIVNSLLEKGVHVIVKPHPAFYRVDRGEGTIFDEMPYHQDWDLTARNWAATQQVTFSLSEQLETTEALASASILITDHSGISFDAFLMDLPVVFFDCPKFFQQYLPKHFGIDGEKAKEDILCNAGRQAGLTARNVPELIQFVTRYKNDPQLHSAERQHLANQLLYNPGRASEIFVNTIEKILRKEYD